MKTTRTPTYGPDKELDGGYVETVEGQRPDSIELAQDAKLVWRVTAVKIYFGPHDTPTSVAERLALTIDAAMSYVAPPKAEGGD